MGDSRPLGTPEAFVLAVALFLKAEPAAVPSFSGFTRLGKLDTSRCPVRKAGSLPDRIGRQPSFANLSPAESGGTAFQWSLEGRAFGQSYRFQ